MKKITVSLTLAFALFFSFIVPAYATVSISTPSNNGQLYSYSDTISGTAAPNSSVIIKMDGTVIGSTTADSSGNYNYVVSNSQCASGTHNFSASEIEYRAIVMGKDSAGNDATNIYDVGIDSLGNPVSIGSKINTSPLGAFYSNTDTGYATNELSSDHKKAVSAVQLSDGTWRVSTLNVVDGTVTALDLPAGSFKAFSTTSDQITANTALSSDGQYFYFFALDPSGKAIIVKVNLISGTYEFINIPQPTFIDAIYGTIAISPDNSKLAYNLKGFNSSIDNSTYADYGWEDIHIISTDPSGILNQNIKKPITADYWGAYIYGYLEWNDDGIYANTTTTDPSNDNWRFDTVLINPNDLSISPSLRFITINISSMTGNIDTNYTDLAGNKPNIFQSIYGMYATSESVNNDTVLEVVATADPSFTFLNANILTGKVFDPTGPFTILSVPIISLDNTKILGGVTTDTSFNVLSTLANTPPEYSDPQSIFLMDIENSSASITSVTCGYVDSVPPSVLGVPDLVSSSDTGVSNVDNITFDSSPTFVGVCVDGDVVKLYIGGVYTGVSGVCSGGVYSLTSNVLSSGVYDVAVSATDPSGNESGLSPVLVVTVDVVVPVAPVIVSPVDGFTTTNTGLSVSGTGEVGATVSVLEGSSVLCSSVVNSSGNWSCDVSGLSLGAHTFSAFQVDVAGNQSLSDSTNITINAVDSVPPSVLGVPDLVSSSDTGVSNVDDVTFDSSPTFVGVCVDGDVVKLYIGGVYTGVSGVCSGGVYSLTSNVLSSGVYDVAVSATDPSGNESGLSPVLVVTVDVVVPVAPVIVSPVDGFSTTNTGLSVSGTGEVGATVSVLEGSSVLCSSFVNSSGNWSCDVSGLSLGAHTFSAFQVDVAGNQSLSDSTNITITAPKSTAGVTVDPVTGQVGTNVITGTGEPGFGISLENDEGDVVCSTTVNEDGSWTCAVEGINIGAYNFVVKQTDLNGNISDTVPLSLEVKGSSTTISQLPYTGIGLTLISFAILYLLIGLIIEKIGRKKQLL